MNRQIPMSFSSISQMLVHVNLYSYTTSKAKMESNALFYKELCAA